MGHDPKGRAVSLEELTCKGKAYGRQNLEVHRDDNWKALEDIVRSRLLLHASKISHEHTCIFVHIPKTGGTSIEAILWPGPRTHEQLWMGCINQYGNAYQTGGLQHLFATHIRKEVGQQTFADYFSFSFVRNPWDRAVSQYSYFLERPDLQQFLGLQEDASFKTYLERIAKRTHVQWDAQHKFLHDEEGQLLVDFVGRFENFEEDIHHVLHELNLQNQPIPHLQQSKRVAWNTCYDDEAKEMVAEFYAKDIRMFQYVYPEEKEGER